MRKLVLMIASLTFAGLAYVYFARGKSCSVTVQVVFGYKDARPARFVGDRYERAYASQRLAELGFRRDKSDDDLFLWKEGLFFRRAIQLRMSHSSVGPDDRRNRRMHRQVWQSHVTREAFKVALRAADAVLYVGHSRNGGGPDFAPPRLTRAGTPDLGWYGRSRPGHVEMVRALKAADRHANVLGLLSCSSSAHFEADLRKRFPRLKVISSREPVYYMDSLQNLLTIIQDLMREPCPT